VPALEAHADEITARFYPLLYNEHPDLVPYFNQANHGKGTQPKALANAVVAYGANIDALGNLSEAVTKIVHKHCSLGIHPAQYDALGTGYLRISVKREPKGVVSNYLHDAVAKGDVVQLLSPCGEFVLRENSKPLVLLTGGVGITPAISMLNAAMDSGRDIRFIHAAIDGNVHAFKDHVDRLTEKNGQLSPFYVYSEPTESCQPHARGFITYDIVAGQLPDSPDVEFYFLGPKPFMGAALKIAKELGVPDTQVHYEFFGPAEELVA
jgi:hemoglobin-like flavoprotein